MGKSSMKIQRYFPRQEKQWLNRADGAFEAQIYTEEGVVRVFSYPGDDRHREFTNLEMYIAPNVYHATLPRHYHERWIRRIASSFAWECGKMARVEAQTAPA